MANTIVVEKEELFTNDMEETIDTITDLIADFIEHDVQKVLSDINDNWNTIELPQTVKLIIKSIDCDDKLVLSKDDVDFIEGDRINEAIEYTSLSEYSDDLYVETEDERITGYINDDPYWEERSYYHYAYADFGAEYDAEKGELAIIAECNARFRSGYGCEDEPDEITREEYIEACEELITDEKTVNALDKALSLGYYDEVKLKEELTEEEKELLTAIGYLNNDDDDYYTGCPDIIYGYAGKMHHVGDGAYCDDDGDNWEFL